MLQLDNDLFLFLNAGPEPAAAVAWTAVFATKFLVLLIPLYIAGLWLPGGRRNRLTAIALCLAFAIALLMSTLIGFVVFRPRPFMVGLGSALVEHRPNSSFPSNHALAFAVWAAVMFMLRRKGAALAAAAVGLVVAWSRIYVGVHYPLDMIGSVIVALLAAMASLWIMDRHGQLLLAFVERAQHRILLPFARTGH